jgi:hypothetical protein
MDPKVKMLPKGYPLRRPPYAFIVTSFSSSPTILIMTADIFKGTGRHETYRPV